MVEEVNSQSTLSGGADRRRAPWSPAGIALITVLFSPLPGGVLHALNYARLGRPERLRLALALNLITTTGLFLVAIFTKGKTPLVLIASLFVAAYFYKSQEHIFRQHRSAGGQKASLLFPAFLSIIGPLILAFGLSYAQNLNRRAKLEEAVTLTEKGEYDKAERGFRAYQQAYPDDMASYWNLAVIYERLGDPDKAKNELRSFLARDSSSKKVREYLDKLESVKQ